MPAYGGYTGVCGPLDGRNFSSKAAQKSHPSDRMAFSGADTRIRTGDLVITNDALYQLSYISTHCSRTICIITNLRI